MSQGFTRGIPIDTDPTLAANSNFLVPSQAAIAAYVSSYVASHAATGSGTANTIYTSDGTIGNTGASGIRTVNLAYNTLKFTNPNSYYFQVGPTLLETNYATIFNNNSNTFSGLTVNGSFGADTALITYYINVGGGITINGSNSGSAQNLLEFTPTSVNPTPASGAGGIYVNSTNNSLYYVSPGGTRTNLVTGGTSMVWPTSNGLAYYNGGSVWQSSISTSSALAGVITDKTGTAGKLVFSISPTITTSILTDTTGTFNLVNTTATAINFAGDATNINISQATFNDATLNIFSGFTASGFTKTINIANTGNFGNKVVFNVGSLTTDITNSDTTFYTNLTVQGNFIVNGSQTTINSTTLQVTDKNIELGKAVAVNNATGTLSGTNTVTLTGAFTTTNMIPGQSLTRVSGASFGTNAKIDTISSSTQFTTTVAHVSTGAITFNVGGPDNYTANGGGITVLDGSTGKRLYWEDGASLAQWTSTENFNLLTGKSYRINNTEVLSSTTLGSGITNSSLTKVGLSTAGIVKTDSSGNLSSGTVALDDLSDVIISSPANKQVVIYDTTSPAAFKNRALIGTDMTVGTAISINLGSGIGLGGYNAGETISATDTIFDVLNKLFQKAVPVAFNSATLSTPSVYLVPAETGTIQNTNITLSWTATINDACNAVQWYTTTSNIGSTTYTTSPAYPAYGATTSNITYLFANNSYQIVDGTTNFSVPNTFYFGQLGPGTISNVVGGTSGTITINAAGLATNLVSGEYFTFSPNGGNAGVSPKVNQVLSSTQFSFTATSGITAGGIGNINVYGPNKTNNLGTVINSTISGGSLTTTGTIRFVGTRYSFWGHFTSDQSAATIGGAGWIRTNLTGVLPVNNPNSQTITMSVGDKCLIFAYPASTANLSKLQQLDSNNNVFAEVQTQLAGYSLDVNNRVVPFTTVTVPGANGYTGVTYNVYKLTSITPYTTQTNFRIII